MSGAALGILSDDHISIFFWIYVRGCLRGGVLSGQVTIFFGFVSGDASILCHMATFSILCSSVVLFITPPYFSVFCQVVVWFFVRSPYVLFVFNFNSGGFVCLVAIFSSVSCQVGGCLGFLCANGHIFLVSCHKFEKS